jgi:cytochrome c oxidase subunit 5b
MTLPGTLEDPITVNSAGNEQYVGCTGCPADSHEVKWLTVSKGRLSVHRQWI